MPLLVGDISFVDKQKFDRFYLSFTVIESILDRYGRNLIAILYQMHLCRLSRLIGVS